MLRWLLAEWWCSLFGGGIIPRDAGRRYVSRRGVAYRIEVAPVAGLLNTVEVSLLAEPVIPYTKLPGLTVVARPSAWRVGAAIRYLLATADAESARMERLALVHEVNLAYEPEMSEELVERMTEVLTDRVTDRVLAQTAAEDLAER